MGRRRWSVLLVLLVLSVTLLAGAGLLLHAGQPLGLHMGGAGSGGLSPARSPGLHRRGAAASMLSALAGGGASAAGAFTWTIFITPQGFVGLPGKTQRRAIQSWVRLTVSLGRGSARSGADGGCTPACRICSARATP